MIFEPQTRPPILLHLRRPRPVWIAGGLVAAIVSGALATTLLVFFAEIPLRIANIAGADSLAWDALGAPLSAGRLFLIAGTLSALFVGAPWYALTRDRPRKTRVGVTMEGFAIAIASAFIAGILIGAVTGAHVVMREGADVLSHWAQGLGLFAGCVLFFGVFGALLAAPAGIAGGLALSFVSYSYGRLDYGHSAPPPDYSY